MIFTNAVIISVILVLIMCLYRINVVIALTTGALICGLIDGFTLSNTIDLFLIGLRDGVTIAFNYALLGAFASATAYSGITNVLADWISEKVQQNGECKKRRLIFKIIFCLLILFMSIACKNIIPVHVAFVPVLIPPLLAVFNDLKIDRRMISCIITFGVIVSYMMIPIGFGEIFLKNIVQHYLAENGLNMSISEIISALTIPASGMCIGLFIAIYRYRRNRIYKPAIKEFIEKNPHQLTKREIIVSILAILGALCAQLLTGATMLGALVGFLIFTFGGVIHWSDADSIVIKGFKMMAQIAFIMLTATGFAHVLKATGDITELIDFIANNVGHHKFVASSCMLLVGFLISVGIGSSFSTVPIITGIYVPLCAKLGFSPAATVLIIASSGVLGDAGSPASDSTLGPSSGLSVDGQHNHISDSVLPSFLHLSIPIFAVVVISSIFL